MRVSFYQVILALFYLYVGTVTSSNFAPLDAPSRKLLDFAPSMHLLQPENSTQAWPKQYEIVREISKNNEVIVTICNYGYLKWLRQWHAHLTKIGQTNWFVVALDNKLYEYLQEHAPGHVILFEDRASDEFSKRLVSGQEVIDSKAKDRTFTRLVSNKPIILERIAAWGFNVFWMDADVFVFTDPFRRLDPTCDFEIQHERRASVLGINSGVFAWKAEKHQQVVQLFRRWSAIMKSKVKDKYFFDQDGLALAIKREVDRQKKVAKTPKFPARATFDEAGVPFTMCILQSKVFRCGNHLPCTTEMKREVGGKKKCSPPPDWEEQKRDMVLAHQNYMSYDEDKIDRAKVLGFWIEGDLPLDHAAPTLPQAPSGGIFGK